MSDAPHDLAAEQAVLGCALMGGHELLAKISGPEHGLRATHFYGLEHGRTYDLMLSLMDRDVPLDAITVRGAVADARAAENPQALIDAVSAVPSVANWATYVKTVREKAYLRDVRAAAHLYMDASETGDLTKLADAERLIEAGFESPSPIFTPEMMADAVLAPRSESSVICPWPWDGLNLKTGGGLRAGQVTVIGGHTNFGKSPACDQILLAGRDRGLVTGLYVNEMTEEERWKRIAAQACDGDPSFDRIYRDDLGAEEAQWVANTLRARAFPVQSAPGWSAEQICRDISRRRWQLAGVDILHNIPYRDQERDLANMMLAFVTCAKRTGCHILLAVHLRKPAADVFLDIPYEHDILGSGMISKLADHVLFVHRERSDLGMLEASSILYLRKVRNGTQGGARASYNGAAMRFDA